MKSEPEFTFLREVLKKCHVSAAVVSLSESSELFFPPFLTNISGLPLDPHLTLREYLGKINDFTQYKFEDVFKCCYIGFLLPPLEDEKILLIGPYLTTSLSPQKLLELGVSLKVHQNNQKIFEEFYSYLPILADDNSVFALINTFCEYIWKKTSFDVVDLIREAEFSSFPTQNLSKNVNQGEITAKLLLIEKRYAFENELIQAVVHGQEHKAKFLMSMLNEHSFEKRITDSLRNIKNYSIIMNTLMRKAAEEGGVHPFYIDSVSSKFAEKIELSGSLHDTVSLMKGMFLSYCRLVYRHSIKRYSPVVQNTVLKIDSDLSSELTLHILAKQQDISPGYLATVFKKETGKTVLEYIWEKRIQHASYLLKNTNLQIQTIAAHCGVMDVQYFSKSFKKMVGKTPREFRVFNPAFDKSP